MLRSFIFSFFLFCSLSIFAQQPIIDKAQNLVKTGNIEKAIALLNKTYTKTNEVAYAYEIVAIFAENAQINEALNWANKIGMEKNSNSIDVVAYSTLLFMNKQYHSALNHCKKHLLQTEDPKAVIAMANACENLINAQNESYKFALAKVPFNSVYDEISITNFRRHFVMSSNGEMAFIEGSKSINNFDIYLLQQDYNNWRYPTKFLRTTDYNLNKTTLSFSKNGNDVFYTSSALPKAVNSKSKTPAPLPVFKIRHAICLGNEWLEDSLLPFQSDEFSFKDPALHPNEKLLIFASNMESKDNYDLFFSEKVDGKWTKPTSLGTQVNSEYEETMPYFKSDGQLYFSSNRPLGFGGYDIYTTLLDGNIWLQPKIMPPPINSEFDDLSITFNDGFPGGYFVSNRKESIGGFDVFEFGEFDLKLSTIVLDNEFGSYLSYAEVLLYLDSNLIAEGMTNAVGETNFSVGPNLKYNLVITKEGYQKMQRMVETKPVKEETIIYTNCRLVKDKTYVQATENKYNNQNFIPFTATFVNENEKPLTNFPVKITNVTQGKIKLLQTDANGALEQMLFIDNEYQFSVDFQSKTIVNTFSTYGLNSSENKIVTFVVK
jgi:tetratricopeptide (TPR) repeat protein